MAILFPEIEAYDRGLLDVGDGHLIHWESYGNPQGRPALHLHGGPGSGSSPSAARYFDPSAYRIVLFDQRNCGRSLPDAADMGTDLSANTTWDLIEDIEKLRHHLAVTGWVLFGTSWGSTLALAYAQTHPTRVSAMVLAGVTITRRLEIDWLTQGMAALFPAEWHRLNESLPGDMRAKGVIEGYRALLNAPDPEVRLKAARDWHDWEAASILLANADGYPRRWRDPAYLLTRARIVTHYFSHAAWLEESVLLRDAGRLASIPGVLVQGRLDLEAPLTTAWELARAWPGSELVVVEDAAHSPAHDGMASAIIAATEKFLEISQK
ncbi:prolyl aminopeptidase [Rhizobium metallidurans]|uniref:Proline iminopeptidase n=1 Tax=Rhizobium metallidurans TaxID=1265931 RepID=A0A7W6GAF2_9HYPH|nr:prolyl aminopeptidase [Rhizobium metallidurans]MBB3964568.1 proline iminopeptidase [Rhizobium metallidurans]